MRILTVFIDMIRANRLKRFSSNAQHTPLDSAFERLGGIAYTNCFTPGPDTPRGIASYYTGLPPYKNGCTTRLRWPEFFLDRSLSTVFDLFLDEGYRLDIFSSPNEKKNGFLPEHIAKMDIHNHDYNLDGYLSKITLEEDHHLFVSLPDYHWAFDDYGYSEMGEQRAYKEVKASFDIIFKHFDKDDFDHIFIFSDHGFKFLAEYKLDPKIYMLNEDRTNIIMLHRQKGEASLRSNEKLCALTDLYGSYEMLLGKDVSRGIALQDEREHEYIAIEDHISFLPQVNQNIELWALVTRDQLYLRTLENAILIDRKTGSQREGTVERYDQLLKESSAFGHYWDEYEKIFLYKQNIVFDKSYYMSGKQRKESPKMIKYYYILFDIIKRYLGENRGRLERG